MIEHEQSVAEVQVGELEHVLAPRLAPLTRIDTGDDGRLRVSSPHVEYALPRLDDALAGTILQLDGNTQTLDHLAGSLASAGSPVHLAMLYAYLARFASQGLLTHHLLGEDGSERAWIQPTGGEYRLLLLPLRADLTFRISRICTMHREQEAMKVSSAFGHAVVWVRDAALVGFLAYLMEARGTDDISGFARRMGIAPNVAAAFLLLCRAARIIEPAPESGTETDDLQLWNVPDLMFHVSSRFGHGEGPFGGNFQHVGSMDPAPDVRPLPGTQRIPLPIPVLDDLTRNDPPLQAVVENRHSIYTYDEDQPITLDDLGEFLYRTSRVRWRGTRDVASAIDGSPGIMAISSRPYPSGGRGFDLELYLTIDRCQDLERGMYHYDPAGHQLSLVRPADALTEHMIMFAGLASPGIRPQVLITMAARFRRLRWKYDRLAYAATLKHVGVLMQQMYLAATAMHLAPSAQGSGDIDAFAAATGNLMEVESSVGEFILGSTPESSRRVRPAMLQPTAAGAPS